MIVYEYYFEHFLKKQSEKVQNKIFKIIKTIETLQRIPTHFLKQIRKKKGLYKARIQLGNNIWRVFCFFDNDQLVILINGFQKKTEKTPKKEIDKASRLMKKYFNEKNK